MQSRTFLNREDVIKLAWAAKAKFREACKHDGISPDSFFVVFSAGNPHAAEYDRLASRVATLRAELRP